MARGRCGKCYLGEFIPVAATISSPCGQGVLMGGGILSGIVCMLYNKMAHMAVQRL